MKSIPLEVKQSGNGFAIYRRQQRIEKIRTITNAVLDTIAGIYQDDFENTSGHLDTLLETLEFDSFKGASLLGKTMGRLLVEHTAREEAKSLGKNPKPL